MTSKAMLCKTQVVDIVMLLLESVIVEDKF